MSKEGQALGKWGEDHACRYLIKKGHNILEKNYRYLSAEIDIITSIHNIIKIVEVKVRSYDYYGTPERFINTKKKKLLIDAAHQYIISKDIDAHVEFDVIAIIKNQSGIKLNYIENAFYPF